MSWTDRCLAFVKKYGKAGKVVAGGVLNVVAPGSGALASLVELACDKAIESADDHWEEAVRTAVQSNADELRRLGQLFELFSGDLARLCDKAAAFADQPEELPDIIARAIAADKTLAHALHAAETIKAQCETFQSDLKRIAQSQEEALPVYARMHRICDYFDELWDAGVKPRDVADLVQRWLQTAGRIATGDTAGLDGALLELRTATPKAASVCLLEVATATREHDYPAAQRALTAAIRLRPGDQELAELSGRVTVLATRATPRQGPTPAPARQPALNPGDTLDGWRLEARLGTGGWGQVFKATRDGLTRAVKVMHPGFAADPAFVKRFRQEISLLLRLPEHPNLVKIDTDGGGFGHCTGRQTWYLVMEYIEGCTLEAHLARNGPLDEAAVHNLFPDLVAGLARAHEVGIAHRDIKPVNMILRQDGQLVLVDFGLAVDAAQVGHTAVGGLSADFAAPEQHYREPATAASDVFSLCAVINYALNFNKPEFRKPNRFSPGTVPSSLRDALTRGMRPNPAERLPDAGQLLAALRTPAPKPPITGLPRPAPPAPAGTPPRGGTIVLPTEFGFGSCEFRVREGKSSSFRVEPVDCLAAATEFALRRLLQREQPTQAERSSCRAKLSSGADMASTVLSHIEAFAQENCQLPDGPRFGGGTAAGGKEGAAEITSWSFCFNYDCEWVGGRDGLQKLRGRRRSPAASGGDLSDFLRQLGSQDLPSDS